LKKAKPVKVELKNSRYSDWELKEQLSELVHYSRYAGINLGDFNKAISEASLVHGQQGLETYYGGKLVLEIDFKTASLVGQLIEMYPVFSTWDIKILEAKKSKSKKAANKKKEKNMAAKKKTAKKKPAKKKPAKKKAAKKAVAKKKPAKKKAAKKKPAKKKAAKKKTAKKK